jgi:ribosomal protein S18 acetylase RimI-like enzyme
MMTQAIELLLMDEGQYEKYLEADLPRYAAENVRAGFWSEAEALGKAKETYARYLPQGIETPGQYLYLIRNRDEGQEVGIVWIGAQPGEVARAGFIYNLYIEEGFRRRGYARATMLAIEGVACEMGWSSLGLHVFGHNRAARDLYESLGYEVRSMNMIKSIEQASEGTAPG